MKEIIENLIKKYDLIVAKGIRYNSDIEAYEIGYGLDSPEKYSNLVLDMDFINLNLDIEEFCHHAYDIMLNNYSNSKEFYLD